MEWSFQLSDLENLREKLRRRESVTLYYPYYSLIPREYQIYHRNRVIGRVIERLLEEKEIALQFLELLNRGSYPFLPGKPLYVLDPYYGRSRPTLDLETKIPVMKLYRSKREGKFEKLTRREKRIILNYIALSLIAEKLKGSLPPSERAPIRKRAVGKLIGYLESHQRERLLILRGDFKDYTLNIPRDLLLKVLERRGVAPHILKLIESYFQRGNQLSQLLEKGNFPALFKEVGYWDKFEGDAHFKSFANWDGILPGTPLSNIFGQIFLLEFDRKLREIVGPDGFVVRFLDDFLVIKPIGEGGIEGERRRVIVEIVQFLRAHYQVPIGKVKQLVRIEEVKGELEFLGYWIGFAGGRVRSRVRYKTTKKFILKYLSRYQLPLSSYSLPKGERVEKMSHYWGAKLLYLYSWLESFYFLNDPKFLDALYRQVVLPDLYSFSKKLGILPQTPQERAQFQKLKRYLRLTTIHRLLKKFQKVEGEPGEFQKKEQILGIAFQFQKEWRHYLEGKL
jgi:hypothetical protein